MQQLQAEMVLAPVPYLIGIPSLDALGKGKTSSVFFAMSFYTKHDHFYQDRLGTNIGEQHSKQRRVFLRRGDSL